MQAAPLDPILGLTTPCKADPSEIKIHVAVGAYRTGEGVPWVLPVAQKAKKSNVTSSNNTLGIRIPNSLSVKSLIKKTGPLLTSSANKSGVKSSTTANEVSNNLPNIDILGPVPWPKCSGEASTIIAWVNYGKWKLIRKGKVFIPTAY